jgi:hypothetical protein
MQSTKKATIVKWICRTGPYRKRAILRLDDPSVTDDELVTIVDRYPNANFGTQIKRYTDPTNDIPHADVTVWID